MYEKSTSNECLSCLLFLNTYTHILISLLISCFLYFFTVVDVMGLLYFIVVIAQNLNFYLQNLGSSYIASHLIVYHIQYILLVNNLKAVFITFTCVFILHIMVRYRNKTK